MWLKIMREKFFKNGQIYYGSFFIWKIIFKNFKGHYEEEKQICSEFLQKCGIM